MHNKEQIFIVDGRPQGKGRPRFTRDGHTYTPQNTAEYERQVQEAYMIQVRDRAGAVPEDQPISMCITAVFPVPKSDNRRVRQAKLSGEILPTTKPDCDNIAKVICDALNGLAYADDRQVVECLVKKVYGEAPQVEVTIAQGRDYIDDG